MNLFVDVGLHLPDQYFLGVILVGNTGDNYPPSAGGGPRDRPGWAKNGSFMVFRELDQLVPEFHKFLWNNPVQLEIPGWSPARLRRKGAELRGAQFVGRWPNGKLLISCQFKIWQYWLICKKS